MENDRWRRADRAYQPAFGHRRAEHHRPDRDGFDCRPAHRDDHNLHRRGEHADAPRARHGLVRPLADVSPVRPNRHVQLIQTIYQIRQAMGGGVLDVIA